MTPQFKTETGHEYREYTAFARYEAPCGITWIPLLVGEHRVQWFADSRVREMFITQYEYTCAEPPPVQGCELPPPMLIFPMPVLYPRDVFLGIANGILEMAKRAVEDRIAMQRLVTIEFADGQLPKAA